MSKRERERDGNADVHSSSSPLFFSFFRSVARNRRDRRTQRRRSSVTHWHQAPQKSAGLVVEFMSRREKERREREKQGRSSGRRLISLFKEFSFFILTFVTFIFQNDSDCWPFIWLRRCHLNHKINEFDIWVPGFSMMDDYILFFLTCHVILKYSTCLDNESRWRYSSRSLKFEENQTIHRVSRGSRQSNIYWESRIC